MPRGWSSPVTLRALLSELLAERCQRVLEFGSRIVVEHLRVADRLQDIAMLRTEIAQHRRLVAGDFLDIDGVDKSLGACIDRGDLLLDRHRAILRLLQELGQPSAT